MSVLLSWFVLVGALCMLLAEHADEHPDERIPLHIGGTFPMEAGSGGWAGGQACLPAVQMALEDVNRFNILPGYVLRMNNSNSKCQPGLATQQLYDLLYSPPVKLMLLVGCSPVTTVVAESAPVWKLTVLSYGASSPALSNRARFPTLFRTHPSAITQNPTRIRLFEKWNYKRVTILQSVEEVFTSTSKDLEESCRKHGIRVERQSFYGDPNDALKTIRRQDARIIVGLYYVTEARRVLCQAYHQGLYGRKYVWLLIGWYADTWYIPPPEEHLNCTAEQMAEAAQYHLTTESIMLSRDEKPTISGMTGKDFQRKLNSLLSTDPANTGGYPEAPLAYDAVWALALALNCTRYNLPPNVLLEHFTYDNELIANELFKCVKETSFRGVSGKVMFSDSGDRIARTQIEQMQDGKYQVVGYYDTTTQQLDWFDNDKWFSPKGPPPDKTIVKETILTVSNGIYFAVTFFAVIGLALTIVVTMFNIKYSGRVVIIQSQPQCNNLMVAGCALCCTSLFFMGLPTEAFHISSDAFPFLCHFRLSILMFGFTFAYGSMFAKVWIAHRMGATQNQQLASSRQKDEPIPPTKFYMVVAAFIALDCVILLCWIVFDPLQRVEQRFPLQEPQDDLEEDIMLQPILELCQSSNQEVWIGLILGYKCLLLVFGLFLSYESRNLKLRYINDSRLVGLAIYNVAILSLVTGPVVTLLIRGQADSNFALIAITVLLCIYISIGLVFVPKMRYVHKVPPSADEIQLHANGNGVARALSQNEKKRYDVLQQENENLQRQIEEKEKRIRECKARLEKCRNKCDDDLLSISATTANNTRSVSDENGTYSTPTTLTTTAHIECQPSIDTTTTGRYVEMENENSSQSSDEILL